MTVTPQHIIRSDMVIIGVNLLGGQSEIQQFRDKAEGDFQEQAGVDLNIQLGLGDQFPQPAPNRTLTFPQDRITLQLSRGRSVIRRDYPSLDNLEKDFKRLSSLARLAIECTGPTNKQPLQSYGYNLQMILTQDTEDTAIDYLANHLFNAEFVKSLGGKKIGGSAMLVVDKGATQWTYRADPWANPNRQSDRLSVSVNCHYTKPTGLPQQDAIASALLGMKSEVDRFLSSL